MSSIDIAFVVWTSSILHHLNDSISWKHAQDSAVLIKDALLKVTLPI